MFDTRKRFYDVNRKPKLIRGISGDDERASKDEAECVADGPASSRVVQKEKKDFNNALETIGNIHERHGLDVSVVSIANVNE